jgi:hypothetical protein
MEDEFRAFQSYQRLIKGEPDEVEYDSGESEADLLSELDQLGDGMPPGAPAPRGADDWRDADPQELLRELDAL